MATVQETTRAEKAFAFLSLLVAYLPKDHYTADASKWATAISDLRITYGAVYPHLFRWLHFRRMPRADSYSPEMSNFLSFLQFTDATTVHNPGFTTMEFGPNTRQLLRERFERLFSSEDVVAIKEMSGKIVSKIRVSSEDGASLSS
jgi:hypothetical protein